MIVIDMSAQSADDLNIRVVRELGDDDDNKYLDALLHDETITDEGDRMQNLSDLALRIVESKGMYFDDTSVYIDDDDDDDDDEDERDLEEVLVHEVTEPEQNEDSWLEMAYEDRCSGYGCESTFYEGES